MADEAKRKTPTTFSPLTLDKPKLFTAPIGRVLLVAAAVLLIPAAITFIFFNIRLRADASTSDTAVSTSDVAATVSPRPDPYDNGSNSVGLPSKRVMLRRSTPVSTSQTSTSDDGYLTSGPSTPNGVDPYSNVAKATTTTLTGGPSTTGVTQQKNVFAEVNGSTSGAAGTTTQTPTPQDGQDVKDIASTTNAHSVTPLLSPYTVTQNTMLPARPIGEVNSDFCIAPTALITSDVYDSINQEYLLIPAGTKAFGQCVSGAAFGQNRIFVAWLRLVLPNGDSVVIDKFAGVDEIGAGAMNANVDAHIGNLFGPAILLTALQAGVSLSAGQQGTSTVGQTQTVGQTMAQSLAQQILNLGTQVSARSLAQVPTLRISAGEPFNIEVLSDMRFRAPYVAEGVQR